MIGGVGSLTITDCVLAFVIPFAITAAVCLFWPASPVVDSGDDALPTPDYIERLDAAHEQGWV
jgi:hypothetical protein